MNHQLKQQTVLYPVGVNDSIRAAVRAEIAKTGQSQAEVARQMGMEPQELSRALQRQGKIPPVWIKILDHFNLDLTVKPKDAQ
ncbi:helix-turn-helix domain-containing protein [Deinococcus irradiatisoli]|uniref:helix-turn-helix domain-containing protein n=1 Tax=Deinococcus irradiatisoli TaxID=2202254 RepID=UPI0011B234FC|nr:helix-turn-helix transcriptional regulator [Deinococcus irradiatisoli]